MTETETTTTAERLARGLRDAGLDKLAERALAGEFDDYRSEHAFPIRALVSELKAAATPENHRQVKVLIAAAKDGEYDATREEARAWRESEEGREAIRQLMEGT